MEISRLNEMKPRSVWEVVDDAFDLYRERFALFASIAAVFYVPAFLVYHYLVTSRLGALLRAARNASTDPTAFFGWVFQGAAIWIPLFYLAYILHNSTTAIAVHQSLSGETPTLGSAFAGAFRRIFPLLLTSVMVIFVSFLGICGLGVGSLLIFLLYIFIGQTVLLEERGILASWKRARDLSYGHYGKVFGMFLLLGLIGSVLSSGFSALISLGYEILPKATGDLQVRALQEISIKAISNSVVSLLLAPLPAIATTLLYYDIRVRREGLDIEAEAERRGLTLAPDPFGGDLNPKVPKRKKP